MNVRTQYHLRPCTDQRLGVRRRVHYVVADAAQLLDGGHPGWIDLFNQLWRNKDVHRAGQLWVPERHVL